MSQKSVERAYIPYLDHLRIAAVLGVMMIHVAGQNMGVVDVMSYPWLVFSVFQDAVTWSVPIFVMISGALLLDPDKNLDIKKLYGVKILRLLTAFVFWAFVYALEKYLKYGDLNTALSLFLEGRYHQWYLLMTIGLYVVTPIFRTITVSSKITQYFLLTGFIFIFIVPDLLEILAWICPSSFMSYLSILQSNFSTINFPISNTYLFYFILGFYISKNPIKSAHRKYAYCTGILSYCIMIALTFQTAQLTGSDARPLSFSTARLAITLAVFTFAQNAFERKPASTDRSRYIRALSRYTFGAYLVHALVQSQIRDHLQFTTLSFDPIISVLLLEAAVAIGSFAISMLLNQIPLLRKYIV